ncbi:unnamed protein product, partial [Amoebophrya sp. A120]
VPVCPWRCFGRLGALAGHASVTSPRRTESAPAPAGMARTVLENLRTAKPASRAMTSRVVIAIKCDRATGGLSKFKRRWLSRGLQAPRFFVNGSAF